MGEHAPSYAGAGGVAWGVVKEQVHGQWLHEGGTRRVCTGGAQTTTVCKVRCRGTVKIGLGVVKEQVHGWGWHMK